MYEIIRRFNDSTFLALKDKSVFVLKKISVEDIEIYKKLMTVKNDFVVRIYEITIVNNEFFAVCEYVHGKTITDIIEKNGVMDRETVKRIVLDICDGLDSIHSLGLVHRDISPNNIMITEDGRAKIIDFGISRLRNNHSNTDTQILGTQGYAAPEQYGFKQTNGRADIYALGVLINYMTTGALPNEKVVSGEFSEIVLKCTQMDENQRYGNVQELKKAIDKKFRFYSFVRKIPGFRKNVWWHKLIAGLYYFSIMLFIIFTFFVSDYGTKDIILTVQFFIFATFVPVFIVFDFNNWLEKFPYTRNKTEGHKVFFKLVLAGAVAFASTLIFGLL